MREISFRWQVGIANWRPQVTAIDERGHQIRMLKVEVEAIIGPIVQLKSKVIRIRVIRGKLD